VKQQDYEIIVSCIQFGAPALTNELLTSLNKTVENSNSWIQEQKRIADEAHKKDVLKAELSKKSKDEVK